MSQITVGYTDKVRRAQPRGPAGGISDIFGFSSDSSNDRKHVQQHQSDTTEQNGQTETKISERTEFLTIEENSNKVTRTVESSKVEVEESQTTNSLNGNARENGNTKENGNEQNTVKQTPQKTVNNIIHADENDLATPQRKNRVPPGGYSSGLW